MLSVLLISIWLAGGALAGWSEDIDSGNERFELAFNTGDIDDIKKLFGSSSDFSCTPGGVSRYGNQAIAEWFNSEYQSGVTKLTLTTEFFTNLGDVANERGMYTMSNGDDDVVYSGMYLTSWFKQDGQLKINMALWT